MRIRCAWHKKHFGFALMIGEKEPLNDDGITDGMCPQCYKIVMLEIDVIERETKRLRRVKELI